MALRHQSSEQLYHWSCNSVVVACISLLVLATMLGCSPSGYDEGYKDGYDDGYDKGHKSGVQTGYERGKKHGFSAGYARGSGAFAKSSTLPTLGFGLVVFFVTGFSFTTYCFVKDPLRRIIQGIAARKEAERQRELTVCELQRKKQACKEEDRVEALRIASDVFKQARQASSDQTVHAKLERAKQQLVQGIINVREKQMWEVIHYYARVREQIDNGHYLSAKERAALYSELRRSALKQLES